MSDATREAARSLRRVKLGERRLHWLKNVPEPVPARPASLRECQAPRRPAALLAKLGALRPPGPVQEVIG